MVGVVDMAMEDRRFDHRLTGETDGYPGSGIDDDPHLLHLRRLDSFGCPLKEGFDGLGFLTRLDVRFCRAALVFGCDRFVRMLQGSRVVEHYDVFIRRVGIVGRGGVEVLWRGGTLLASLGVLLQDMSS